MTQITTSTLWGTSKKFIKSILPPMLLNIVRHLRATSEKPTSTDYEVIDALVPDRVSELLKGWTSPIIPQIQQAAFDPLLRQMRAGNPRQDFVALATAMNMIGLANPLLIEVGCGSGWNREVLACLWKRPFRYVGLDYSPGMTDLGKQRYPDTKFAVGDATCLPFQDGACDILLSGTVLMHLLGYQQAIWESCRLTRQWCIFHTVPVLQHRKTTILSKKAYSQPTIEVIFNERELYRLFEQNRLVVRKVIDSMPYNLESVLGEPTFNKTYLCQKIA